MIFRNMFSRKLAVVVTSALCVFILFFVYGWFSDVQFQCRSTNQTPTPQTPNRLIPNETGLIQTAAPSVGPFDSRRLELVFNGDEHISINVDMPLSQVEDLYYQFVNHLHYTCDDYVRLGSAIDGGWDVCIYGPYRLARPCLVYSFGINNDFSFDDAVSIKFGCTVRAFDPSMDEVVEHRRGPNIWFYKTGIGGSDIDLPPSGSRKNRWRLRTLQTIMNELGDTNKTIDYLKIDVEDAEWGALEAMFKTDILQSRVKQIGIEVHLFPQSRTVLGFYQRYKTMKQLEDIGYRRWYWHFNHWGTYNFNGRFKSCCYEMVYINKRFMEVL